MRNKRLAQHQAHRPFAGPDMMAHGRFRHRHARELRQDPAIDAPRRMTLLARRMAVRVENLVDERDHRVQLRLGPRRVTMRRRKRSGNRLPHHAPVHAELGRNTRDRADPKLMLLTKLLKQFHSGDPIHSEPPGETEVTLG